MSDTQPQATTALTEPDAPAAVTARADFVYAEGQNFMLNGQRFRHVGVNIPHLLYETPEQQDRELAGAAAVGVRNIRILLPNTEFTGAEIRARLASLLDRALARGIRLTVAMTHAYLITVGSAEHRHGAVAVMGDYPSRPANGYPDPLPAGGFYTREIPTDDGKKVWMLSDSWVDWGHHNSYEHLLWQVAQACRDHAGIFAWDISNEVNVSNTRDLLDIEVNYYKRMAAQIKAADPNHLVTTGAISTHWLGLTTDEQKNRLYRDPNIDYVVVHEYDDEVGDRLQHTKDDIARANHTGYFNKPVIVEEFGAVLNRETIKVDGVPLPPYPTGGVIGHVRRYYQRHFFGDPAFRVDAILQWGVTFHDEDTGNNDAKYGPKAQQKFDDYAAVWRDYSQRLASDNQFPNAIIIDNYYIHNDSARAKVTASASWTPSTYVKQFWGTGYQTAVSQVGVDDPFVFSFFVPGTTAQIKTIDAWWSVGPTRSTQAPFRIEAEDGRRLGSGVMNQRERGGAWNKLGTWTFPPGWNRIVFSRAAQTSGEALIADAVRVR